LLDKTVKTVLNATQLWVLHVKATNARKISLFCVLHLLNIVIRIDCWL